jgi:hypothetical protein
MGLRGTDQVRLGDPSVELVERLAPRRAMPGELPHRGDPSLWVGTRGHDQQELVGVSSVLQLLLEGLVGKLLCLVHCVDPTPVELVA